MWNVFIVTPTDSFWISDAPISLESATEIILGINEDVVYLLVPFPGRLSLGNPCLCGGDLL